MDQAYHDKLDAKIPEDFWERRMREWSADEQRIQEALARLEEPVPQRLLTAQRTLELANKAYSLYLTRSSAEQAQLLKMVLLNCTIDATSVHPTYKKPFDLIFQRAKKTRMVDEQRFELPAGFSVRVRQMLAKEFEKAKH